MELKNKNNGSGVYGKIPTKKELISECSDSPPDYLAIE